MGSVKCTLALIFCRAYNLSGTKFPVFGPLSALLQTADT